LLEISKPNVVVSTLKPGRDGSAVLRVYEASGQSTQGVKIALHVQVDSAFETNLIEQSGGKLNVQDNAAAVRSRPLSDQDIPTTAGIFAISIVER
jgi:alpha-mannosidase